jgi:hypothetical protein
LSPQAHRPPLLIEIRRAVKSAVTASSFAVPPAALVSDQRFELASILAAEVAAQAARLMESAVFAAVTSKSGPPVVSG